MDLKIEEKYKKILVMYTSILLNQKKISSMQLCLEQQKLLLCLLRKRVATKKKLLSLMTLYNKNNVKRKVEKRIWVLKRTELNFFQQMLQSNESADLWPHYFRLTKETFFKLVELLRDKLTKEDTQLRKSVPVESRVAVGLTRLVTGKTYKAISNEFCMGTATVKLICGAFEAAVCDLTDELITFPKTDQDILNMCNSFEEQYKFPQILGCLGTTRLKIRPYRDKEEYVYKQQFPCVATQIVCNANMEFLHVATGFPGSYTNTRMLNQSMEQGELDISDISDKHHKIINGQKVKLQLVGDGSYPSNDWILKPYPFAGFSEPKKTFNDRFSTMRSIVNKSFGLLKGRFEILTKESNQLISNIPKCVTACATLHNFCIKSRDPSNVTCIEEEEEDSEGESVVQDSDTNKNVRDCILQYMSNGNIL